MDFFLEYLVWVVLGLLTVVVGFFAVVGFVLWLSKLVEKLNYGNAPGLTKRVRDTPKKTVAAALSAKEAQSIRLVGTIEPLGEALRSPITQQVCVGYEVFIEKYRQPGRLGEWESIVIERRNQDFLLKDGTGVALIKANDETTAVAFNARVFSGLFRKPEQNLVAFLNRQKLSTQELLNKYDNWFRRGLRYHERLLLSGDSVGVVGVASQQIDPTEASADYRENPQQRLVLDGKIVVSDHKKAKR